MKTNLFFILPSYLYQRKALISDLLIFDAHHRIIVKYKNVLNLRQDFWEIE